MTVQNQSLLPDAGQRNQPESEAALSDWSHVLLPSLSSLWIAAGRYTESLFLTGSATASRYLNAGGKKSTDPGIGAISKTIAQPQVSDYTRVWLQHWDGPAQSVQWLGYRMDERGMGVRFPVGVRDFSLFHKVQTDSGTHQALYTTLPGAVSPGVKWQGVKLNTHINLVPMPRMVELYLHSPIHVFIESWSGA
jgi:hypothetical protein